MAIKAYEYLAIGEEMFKCGSARPVGDSWQVKAQQKGFDEAQARATPTTKANDISNPAWNHSSGVVHHIRFLRAEYHKPTTNDKRASRLLRKANKLAAKHGLLVPQSL